MPVHIRVSNENKMAQKWATVDESERKFNKHWLSAVNLGFASVDTGKQSLDSKQRLQERYMTFDPNSGSAVYFYVKNGRPYDHHSHKLLTGLPVFDAVCKKYKADLTWKQYTFLKDTGGVVTASPTRIYSSSDFTATKAPFYLTTKLAHSPLREINDSSKRNTEGRFLSQTVLEIAKYRGYDKPQAYFMTLTVPNCDLGELSDTLSKLMSDVAKVTKALKDGTNNKNGLRLPSFGSKKAQFLGSLISFEITVNQLKLSYEEGAGLFHPHCHLILLFDRPLAQYRSSKTMFDYWKSKNVGSWLSEEAFSLEPCYDRETGTMDITSAMHEASKYAVKPDFYKRFPHTPSEFSTKVFTELMRSIKSRQLKRRTGLFYDAQGFNGWGRNGIKVGKKHYDIYSAMLSSHYVDEPDKRVPDVYTHSYAVQSGHILTEKKPFRSDFGALFKDCDDRLSHMTRAEIIYANAGLLMHSIFELPDDTVWPDTDKAQLYKWLLSRMKFFNLGTVKDWASDLKARADDAEAKSKDDDDALSKHAKKLRLHLSDIELLSDALEHCGGVTKEFRLQYQRLALFDQLKRHRAIIKHDADGKVCVEFGGLDPTESREIERKLAHLYLSDDLEQFEFISDDVLLDYNGWRNGFESEYENEDNLPDKLIELDSSMTPDAFQKWVDVTLS